MQVKMPEEIEQIAYIVPVRTSAAGEPLCGLHELAMVLADDGKTWTCPTCDAMMQQLFGSAS